MNSESFPPPPGDLPAADARVLGPRKRIVAREVQSAALTDLQPADLSDLHTSLTTAPPRRVRPEPLVVDPTVQLGERHRRHSHNRAYYLTALTAALAFAAATGGIALLLTDRLTAARLAAAAGVILAAASVWLARTSRLAGRLRGYAIAAGILAAVSLAANLAGGFIHDAMNEPKTAIPNRVK